MYASRQFVSGNVSSAGLRVGEVVRLKVSGIDSKRMQIRVTAGKGAKDRYILLSETAVNVLASISGSTGPGAGFFLAQTPRITCPSDRRGRFLNAQERRRASPSPRRSIHCAIRLQRICWKTT